MCGIAGFSLSPDARVDRTLAAQALLAAIAERGADAVGYAHRAPGGRGRRSHKQRTPAPASCSSASRCPADADPAAHPRARLHEGPPVDRREQPPGPPRAGGRDPQRDHRQRRRALRAPRLRARRARDDRRLRGDLRARRARPGPTPGARGAAGSMAAAWLDEREPGLLFARPRRRPAALARPRPRRDLLRLDEARARARRALRRRQAPQARGARGHAASRSRDGARRRHASASAPDAFVEDDPLPAVRAPQERDVCLTRLASLAAAA